MWKREKEKEKRHFMVYSERKYNAINI